MIRQLLATYIMQCNVRGGAEVARQSISQSFSTVARSTFIAYIKKEGFIFPFLVR